MLLLLNYYKLLIYHHQARVHHYQLLKLIHASIFQILYLSQFQTLILLDHILLKLHFLLQNNLKCIQHFGNINFNTNIAINDFKKLDQL